MYNCNMVPESRVRISRVKCLRSEIMFLACFNKVELVLPHPLIRLSIIFLFKYSGVKSEIMFTFLNES